jgi:DNA-directed RNA polymerase specialized sigma24 family protein
MLKVWSKASVAVLRAAYIDGLSMREIAEHHSLPLGTVKTRARNALARLRCLLW